MKKISAAIVAIVFLVANAAGAAAQNGVNKRVQLELLPADHWSIGAARRLHSAGVTLKGFDPSAGMVQIERMRSVLQSADTASRGFAIEVVAHTILAKFEEEFPQPGSPASVHLSGLAGAGISDRAGLVEVSRYVAPAWTGGPAMPDGSAALLRGYLNASIGSHVSFTADVRHDVNGTRVNRALASTQIGPVQLFGGVATPGFLTTRTGSVVLQGTAPLTGAGFFLAKPVVLPGVLRHIGPIGFQSNLGMMDGIEGVPTQWFFDARMSVSPFPSWMGFSITRAAMFGALSPGGKVTASDLLSLIVGQNSRDGQSADYADNQVVAVDGWFRAPPTIIPLKFYWDWGADDSAGAWWRTAGRVFGLELASVPGLPASSIAIERVLFEHPRRQNGPWYLHSQYVRGWSREGVSLAHPLGGHGRATALVTRIDHGPVRAEVTLFAGSRGADNMFAPAHSGRVSGWTTDFNIGVGHHATVAAQSRFEFGSDWQSRELSVFLQRPLH